MDWQSYVQCVADTNWHAGWHTGFVVGAGSAMALRIFWALVRRS